MNLVVHLKQSITTQARICTAFIFFYVLYMTWTKWKHVGLNEPARKPIRRSACLTWQLADDFSRAVVWTSCHWRSPQPVLFNFLQPVMTRNDISATQYIVLEGCMVTDHKKIHNFCQDIFRLQNKTKKSCCVRKCSLDFSLIVLRTVMNHWREACSIWYQDRLQTFLQIIHELLFVSEQLRTCLWCKSLRLYPTNLT
jgi:hypothetical protein